MTLIRLSLHRLSSLLADQKVEESKEFILVQRGLSSMEKMEELHASRRDFISRRENQED